VQKVATKITPKALLYFAWALPLTLYGSVIRRRPASVLGKVLGPPTKPVKDLQLNPQRTSDNTELLIGQSVVRASRLLPGDHNCLTQAIAAQQMLKAIGKPSQVIIGLQENTGDEKWGTHAWLITANGNVVGGEIAGNFTPVTIFGQTSQSSKSVSITAADPVASSQIASLVSRALQIELGIQIPNEAETEINFDLVELARHHRVEGILLSHAAAIGVPKEIEKELIEQARSQVLGGLRLTKDTLAVGSLFDADGIEHLIFKGVALSALSMRDISARGAGDVDVLVDSKSVPRAHRMLVANGFTPRTSLVPSEKPIWKFWSFRDRELGYTRASVDIDLHWIVPRDTKLSASTAAQLARSQRVTIANGSVQTLCPGDALNACAVHIYVDFCHSLRLLVDLAYLSNLPGITLPEDVPGPGRQLVADVLEFARHVLGPSVFPTIPGVPKSSEKSVARLIRMWEKNSAKPLAEASSHDYSWDYVARLKHELFYNSSFTQVARVLSLILFDIPKYSKGIRPAGLITALLLRLRQLATGTVPHRQTLKNSQNRKP
jgi:hypothetical protein